MILIEVNAKDLFQTRLAILEIVDNYVTLTFDEPFGQGRNKFKSGDSTSREYFSVGEINYMKKELKIKNIPYEIYNEYVLEDVYKFIRKG